MFEHGSFGLGSLLKGCRAKVAKASKRHAASHSSSYRGQYSEIISGQETTRQKSTLTRSLQNFATNAFSRGRRRRRNAEEWYNSHTRTSSTSTLLVQPSQDKECFTPEFEQTATQTQTPPSRSRLETATAPAEIGITLQSQRPNPVQSTGSVNIQKIPARYRLRIRQLTRDAAKRAEMDKDNKAADNRDSAKPRGLPRSSTSYRLSSLAIRGNGSNIPLPSSSSTSFGFSTASSRRMSQQRNIPSDTSHTNPQSRSSIAQRYGHEATEREPEAMSSSSRGFSKGTVNNPTRVSSGLPVAPQRQLMQPLGPPFPRSQTLSGPAFHPTSANVTEEKEPSNLATKEVEDNNTEISFDMCEVVEDEETVEDEDEETVEVLRSTCPPKSEIEKERKWKMTPLERIGNRVGVGVETAPELPAEGPPEGGWLWDEDESRLVSLNSIPYPRHHILTIPGEKGAATAILVRSLQHHLEQLPP